MSTNLAWLSNKMKTHLSESGLIRRDSAETPSVDMRVGKTMADVEGMNGVTVRTNIADFLITAADYKINGIVVEPKRGDEIDYGGKTYRAMPIAGGEVWRYAENVNRTVLRIHAKEVGDAS